MTNTPAHRLTSIVTGLSSGLVLLALLVGVPAGLLFLVGNPLPAAVPDWSAVASTFEHGDIPTDVIVNVVAIVVWLWWIQVALATAAEVLAVVRGRIAQRLVVMPGVQSGVTKLVAGVLLGVTSIWGLTEAELINPSEWLPDRAMLERPGALAPDGATGPRVVAAAAGTGLVAGGLVLTVRRLRGVQRRRRNSGEYVKRPSVETRDTERTLIAAAALDQLGVVGAALGTLDMALDGMKQPPIVGISHTAESVTMLLEDRLDAPPPFITVDDGYAWEIQTDALPDASDLPWSARAPEILVTAGWHEKSGSEVILNLEHIGHLGIGGAESDALPMLTTMAAELATSPFPNGLEVLCVGFGSSLDHLERLRVVPRLSDLLGELEAGADTAEAQLVAVVLDPFTGDREVLARLEALVGSGVLALTANGSTHWRLVCKPNTITVWPVDLTLRRRELDVEAIEHLQEIVQAAAATTGEAADPDFEIALRDLDLPEPEVEIAVLGAIQVRGIDQAFSSRVAMALVTYLAFHRDGATADQLKRWLWHPDSPPTDKLFANTISRARTTLGANSCGELHLPRLGSDRLYRLADSVGTDVDRFRALLDAADEQPEHSRPLLRQALELVRGLVFAGGDDQPFAWADHTIRSHVEFMVDESAHRLADEALAVGDSETARWAALAGLRLIPDCESCFRRRFLAADLAGNRTELKRTMAELRRLVAIDASLPDASDVISPELEALYADLLVGRPIAV